MSKVTVRMKDGRLKTMQANYARTLVYCKKAVYVDQYENKKADEGFVPAPVFSTAQLPPPPLPVSLTHVPEESPPELEKIRAEYKDRVGKKPYHGWTVEVLKQKLEELV